MINRATWTRAGLVRYALFCGDFGSRVALQALYFIFISRVLGASGFGSFASLTATTTLASCFSGLGTEQILISRASNDDFDMRHEWGRTLKSTALTFVPLLLTALVALHWVLKGEVSIGSIAAVVVTELLFTRLTSIASAVLYVRSQIILQFMVNVLPMILRVVSASAATFLAKDLTVGDWCLLYAAATVVAGLFAGGSLLAVIGRPRFDRPMGRLGDGFLFSMEFASLAAFRDIDKPVVITVLGPALAGSYAAAFRIVDTSCVPSRALLQSTYIRYFSKIKESRAAALAFARRNALLISTIGGAIGILLVGIAPYIPLILGPEYQPAVGTIMIMAIYPIVLGLSGVGSDVLRALGLQRVRLIVLTLTYVSYVPGIWFGATHYGLLGAAVARMIIQASVAALTWGVVIFRGGRPETPCAEIPA